MSAASYTINAYFSTVVFSEVLLEEREGEEMGEREEKRKKKEGKCYFVRVPVLPFTTPPTRPSSYPSPHFLSPRLPHGIREGTLEGPTLPDNVLPRRPWYRLKGMNVGKD